MIQKKPVRLITIPISHYCEKVRWALTRVQIPYVEEPHMPPFHLLATGRVGGKLTPVLIAEDSVFTDSTAILQYLNKIAPTNTKLYPDDAKLCQQVEELENLFDEQLGPATRTWGYFHAMSDTNLIERAWCSDVPVFEKALFPVFFPVTRLIVQRKFNLTPEAVKQSYEQMESIFARVSEMLADGRVYLVGDSLSAADITFAALAAPALAPPEHPKKPDNLQDLPPQMVAQIQEFRQTPAGAFVLRLYSDDRAAPKGHHEMPAT